VQMLFLGTPNNYSVSLLNPLQRGIKRFKIRSIKIN